MLYPSIIFIMRRNVANGIFKKKCENVWTSWEKYQKLSVVVYSVFLAFLYHVTQRGHKCWARLLRENYESASFVDFNRSSLSINDGDGYENVP